LVDDHTELYCPIQGLLLAKYEEIDLTCFPLQEDSLVETEKATTFIEEKNDMYSNQQEA